MERNEETASSVTKDAREQAILDNLGLVYYVYGRMKLNLPAGMEPEDAISYGVIGLMQALDRFDVSKGRFATYAYPRIQGAILDGMSQYVWSRRPELKLYDSYQDAKESKGESHSQLEVAEEMDLTPKRYQHLLTTLVNSTPLSLEGLQETDEIPTDGFLEEWEQKQGLKDISTIAFGLMTREEKQIVHDRIYLQITFQEIGDKLGMSASTACRRYNSALDRVRQYFKENPI